MLPIYSALAFAAAAFAAPPLAPAVTTSATGPNPTEVTISSIAYGGTGCPQGSVGSYISPDRQTLATPNTIDIYQQQLIESRM